jgi:hypothetical protein
MRVRNRSHGGDLYAALSHTPKVTPPTVPGDEAYITITGETLDVSLWGDPLTMAEVLEDTAAQLRSIATTDLGGDAA